MSRDPSSGILLVLSAPTGGGKTTIARRLAARDPLLRFSVSHTTRSARPGEKEGVDYHFVDGETFRAMAARGEFLEWAKVHDHEYGTHRSEWERAVAEGRGLILDIDVQGGLQVKKAEPDSLLVFILPPSLHVLLDRLGRRAIEQGFDLRRRLESALAELELAGSYDYNVINEDLDGAVDAVAAIVAAARLRPRSCAAKVDELQREITQWLRSTNVHRG